jgi:hypothetical protein
MDCGSPYRKAALRLALAAPTDLGRAEIEIKAVAGKDVSLSCLALAAGRAWQTPALAASAEGGLLSGPFQPVPPTPAPETEWYGTADIIIKNVRFFQDEKESLCLTPCRPWRVLLDYEIKTGDPPERIEILVVFQKESSAVVRSFMPLAITGATPRQGRISLGSPWLPLGRGEYFLSVAVVKGGYSQNFGKGLFYTVDPDVLCSLPRCLLFDVSNGPGICENTATILEMRGGFLDGKGNDE